MAIHVHLMDRSRPLGVDARARLLDPVAAACRIMSKHAPDLDADLVVIPTDIYDHPRWYRSGKAFGPGCAQIEVNPDHARFDQAWVAEAVPLVLHELHHCLRWPYAQPGWTIGEVVVLEGLAMLAESTDGTQPTQFGDAPPDDMLGALCDKAYAARHQSESDQTAWFRDTTCDGHVFEAPLNYHIGQAMMARALSHLRIDPFQAARLPSETLFQTWRAQP